MMTNEGRSTQLWQPGAECTLHLSMFLYNLQPTGFVPRTFHTATNHQETEQRVAPASEGILMLPEFRYGQSELMKHTMHRKHLYKVMSFMNNISMGHIQTPQGNYCIVGKFAGP